VGIIYLHVIFLGVFSKNLNFEPKALFILYVLVCVLGLMSVYPPFQALRVLIPCILVSAGI
jgi:hypothetical protein